MRMWQNIILINIDVDRDYWMNSNEAVGSGIADEIIVNNKDK